MAEGLVLSIDGMGGDNAPGIVIEGVEIAAQKTPGVSFLIHGDPAKLEPLLAHAPTALPKSKIVQAEKVIGMEVKPSQAMRQGKGSSLWNAIAAVEKGEAHAVVSAGNTGALMAVAMFRLRTMEGVHRPALVASWPNSRGVCTVLDVGANVEADAEQLVEFAIMGEAFHRAVHGTAKPTVGLLNVGAEDQKGHDEIREAARLARMGHIEFDFHGFVEGDDIGKGTVDVVVTDGFTGNIALKAAEGTARWVAQQLRAALTSSAMGKIGALIATPALRKLRERLDPNSSNGGVFLGLNGVVVKSHGGATGPGFAAAIDIAARLAKSPYRDEIKLNLARLAEAEALAAQTASAGSASA